MTDTAVVSSSTRPDRPEPAVAPWLLTTYRVFAYITGVLLVVNSILLIAFLGDPEPPVWYALSWTGHGWAYMAYFATSVAIAFTMRWPVSRSLLVVLAGLVPGMSFVAERWVVRNVVVAGEVASATAGHDDRAL
jgi:integral membrane protein